MLVYQRVKIVMGISVEYQHYEIGCIFWLGNGSLLFMTSNLQSGKSPFLKGTHSTKWTIFHACVRLPEGRYVGTTNGKHVVFDTSDDSRHVNKQMVSKKSNPNMFSLRIR
jgi:hypothetical protein